MKKKFVLQYLKSFLIYSILLRFLKLIMSQELMPGLMLNLFKILKQTLFLFNYAQWTEIKTNRILGIMNNSF